MYSHSARSSVIVGGNTIEVVELGGDESIARASWSHEDGFARTSRTPRLSAVTARANEPLSVSMTTCADAQTTSSTSLHEPSATSASVRTVANDATAFPTARTPVALSTKKPASFNMAVVCIRPLYEGSITRTLALTLHPPYHLVQAKPKNETSTRASLTKALSTRLPAPVNHGVVAMKKI